jgi:membrane protein
LLFAALYKLLPDVHLAWRDMWIGALVTAALFTVGKFLIGLYLGRSAAVSVYGAAGSLVLILLWVYYSSIIFLFGAEFTQVYARWRGAAIEPSDLAQFIDEHCSVPADRRTTRRSRKSVN